MASLVSFRGVVIFVSLCAAAASATAQTVTPGNSLCIRFRTNPPFLYPPFPAFGALTPDRLELSLVVRATGGPQVTTRLFDGNSQLASMAGSVTPLVDAPPDGVFQARFTHGPIASAPGTSVNFAPLHNGSIKGLLQIQINTGSLEVRPSPLLLLMRAPAGSDPAETVSDFGWVTVEGMALCGSTAPGALTANRSALHFGGAMNGGVLTSVTAAQPVALTQTGGGVVNWTATSNQPWLRLGSGLQSTVSGSGTGSFTIGVVNSNLPGSGTLTGTVTVTNDGGATTPQVAVTLRLYPPTTLAAPAGAFDTPVDGANGVAGSIAVTGWAVDDIEVARVRILRDPVAGEPAGSLVFIGNATLVEGARPDVQATFPGAPHSSRLGWGYLLLTNFLPGLGDGTYRLHAIADDVDGHSTSLGTKTITAANSSATTPFGAIDTPDQGGTVSGTVTNFGWVLSRGLRRADPPGGGTVRLVIDGALLSAVPAGWSSRADLSALFPAAQYPGIGTALGVASFDSTTLANGVHTIAWLVTDNMGGASGIGSRYFTVSNGSSLTMGGTAATAPSTQHSALSTEHSALSTEPSALKARRGFDPAAPYRTYEPDADGRVTIQAEELDRIEVLLEGVEGSRRVEGAAEVEGRLPIGSRIDPATGIFTWSPGVGFLGTFDLVLAGRNVRIVLNPQGSLRLGMKTVIDVSDGGLLAGWAADLDAPAGTGIETLHVWAYPIDGGAPQFVGVAEHGGARGDVAAIYGARFLNSGFAIATTGLAPGTYDLAVFPYSTAKRGFGPARTVRVTVR